MYMHTYTLLSRSCILVLYFARLGCGPAAVPVARGMGLWWGGMMEGTDGRGRGGGDTGWRAVFTVRRTFPAVPGRTNSDCSRCRERPLCSATPSRTFWSGRPHRGPPLSMRWRKRLRRRRRRWQELELELERRRRALTTCRYSSASVRLSRTPATKWGSARVSGRRLRTWRPPGCSSVPPPRRTSAAPWRSCSWAASRCRTCASSSLPVAVALRRRDKTKNR